MNVSICAFKGDLQRNKPLKSVSVLQSDKNQKKRRRRRAPPRGLFQVAMTSLSSSSLETSLQSSVTFCQLVTGGLGGAGSLAPSAGDSQALLARPVGAGDPRCCRDLSLSCLSTVCVRSALLLLPGLALTPAASPGELLTLTGACGEGDTQLCKEPSPSP